MLIQEYNFIFDPHFNVFRISQRKLRRKLLIAVYGVLLIAGLIGLLTLIMYFLSSPEIKSQSSLRFFYFSLLLDMVLFYLWQRSKERIKKLKLPTKGDKIEIFQYFDQSVQRAFETAWLIALRKRHNLVQPIHLFLAFLKSDNLDKLLKRLDCKQKEVGLKAKKVLDIQKKIEDTGSMSLGISPDLEKVFFDAYSYCLKQQSSQISILDLLWAMSQSQGMVNIIFDEFGITQQEMEQATVWAKTENQILAWKKSFSWLRLLKPKGKINRAMTAAATPWLKRASEDYTLLARQGVFEIILGRQKEINQIFRHWSAGQVGVVLVGQSGIGKKTIVQRIAQMMVEEDIPKFLQDKRLIKLDLGSLMGLEGSRERGEEFFKNIIYEINRAGHIILYIEDIDNLVGLKAQANSLDFAELIASALDNKAFYLICSTTKKAYASKIEDGILGRVLRPIKVKPPEKEDLIRILAAKVFSIEEELGVVFSVDAINQTIDLADRFLYGQALVAKSVDLLEEVASIVRGRRGKNALIKDSDISKLISKKTDIPLTQVQEVEKKKLLNLEKAIHRRMINQEKAVEAVANALRRSRLHIQKTKRPIANFLFVGPTGVGKTELAKTLAQVYFGDENRMVRLDMSEYQEKRALRRLIGAKTDTETSKGYLTESIKRQPHTLLLLDEIEKAHPDILNLFLQVMDDGRLTDVTGETINFSSVILIATSNAGTKVIQDQISQGKSYDEINKDLKENVLLEYFRPEYLNRFDSIILFNPLDMENMIEITKLFLKRVKNQMTEKGIEFKADDDAIRELAKAGYDPLYGARPLRRAIQDKVDDTLAKLLLENRITRRDKVIMKKGEEFEIIKGVKI